MTAGHVPFAPIEARLATVFGRPRWATVPRSALELGDEKRWASGSNGGWTDQEAARLFRVTRRTIARWRLHGIDLMVADNVALSVGRMPWELWPEWGGASLELADRIERRREARSRAYRLAMAS